MKHEAGAQTIHQDLRHQQIDWTIERIGWAFMALCIVGALAGLLGSGPLSTAEATAKGLRVEYERFIRHEARATLRVHVLAPSSGEQIRLHLNSEFINTMQIQRIEPVPEHAVAAEGRTTYVFNSTPEHEGTTITFHLEPVGFGTVPVTVGIDNGGETTFKEFVFP